MRVLFKKDNYRIVEFRDDHFNMEDLKGDCYNPEVNYDIAPETLKSQEQDFENKVYGEGVYGYELQEWNPEVDAGWEHIDSCWGFVGAYEESGDNNHYIVEYLKSQIG